MERWFTSDTHFRASNIIELQSRPYTDVIEMEDDIVAKWNEAVKPGDIVYHLGDFAMPRGDEKAKIQELFKRLNGQKHLICGNHDYQNPFIKNLGWAWVGDIKSISIDGHSIFLCHYPMLAWNGSMTGSWHLHGHTHGLMKQHSTWLKEDVGVDVHGYKPVSYEEVKCIMSRRNFMPPDKRPVFYYEDLTSKLF